MKSRALVLSSLPVAMILLVAVPARAQEASTEPATIEAQPTAPAPPAPSQGVPPRAREAASTADAPLDRVTGHVSLGGTILTETKAPALGTLRVGINRWFRNVGLVASLEVSANGDAIMFGFDGGVRVLGSQTSSGPFAGVGLGVLHSELRSSDREGFDGEGTRGTFYSELGVIARGTFLASLRVGLPLSALEGKMYATADRGAGPFLRPTDVRITPLAISAQVGVMF